MTQANVCQADDCDNPTRTRRAQYCEKHYYRLRRNGTLTVKQIQQPNLGRPCSAEDCDRIEHTKGLCRKHYIRLWRHGDPAAFIAPADRAIPKGPQAATWAGDQITYAGFHCRLRNLKGPASAHPCGDCGTPAKHWSYDHTDPDERTSSFGPYSVDLNHYVPRCVPCHKRFDLGRRDAGSN